MKMHYLEPFWTNDSKASSETPYDDLAAAIVKQAANDYVRVIRTLWQKNLKIIQKRNLLLEKVELEEFFIHPGTRNLRILILKKSLRDVSLMPEKKKSRL